MKALRRLILPLLDLAIGHYARRSASAAGTYRVAAYDYYDQRENHLRQIRYRLRK